MDHFTAQDESMSTLGNRLRTIRESRYLTQAELAERIGVKQLQISRYELGKAEPRLEFLIKFSQNMGVSLDWLCGLRDTIEIAPLTPEAIEAGELLNSLAANDQRILLSMIQLMAGELRLRSRQAQAGTESASTRLE